MSPAEEVKAPPKINRGLFNVYLDLTAISDVDGVRGRLSYRGMAIEQLAGHVPYIDVFHLLVVGRLPSEADRVAMEAQLAEGERLAADLLGCVGDLACGEPLVGLRIALSACGPLRSLPLTASRAAELRTASLRTLGLAGAVIRHQAQVTPGGPHGNIRRGPFTASILSALIGRVPSPLECELIDLAFVALAEHGLAASTLSARIVASAEGEFAGAVTAAMSAFAGRLHGGAIDEVTAMLMEIGTPDRATAWVSARQQQRQRVPGFGHRVYRTRDPRADILAGAAQRLAAADNKGRTLLDVMDALGEEMRGYRQHGIDFNVDAYASVLFLTLGIPRQFFVPLFALARIAGWCAHIEEQVRNNILIRPRLLYRGAATSSGAQHE